MDFYAIKGWSLRHTYGCIYLNDRETHLSLSCIVEISLRLTHSGPLLLLRGMKYLFGQPQWDHSYQEGAAAAIQTMQWDITLVFYTHTAPHNGHHTVSKHAPLSALHVLRQPKSSFIHHVERQ